MGKLVEATHVSLGGQIDELEKWALPYLDEDHNRHASRLLADADALLLGRRSYEGLADAYLGMAATAEAGAPMQLVERMNEIPKFVASRSGAEVARWNASRIDGDVAEVVADLKAGGTDLLKYGNGTLDATLVEQGLIDEFHLFLAPIGTGRGERLFAHVASAPQLKLEAMREFESGVLLLVYTPR